jgi:hypothetical protein
MTSQPPLRSVTLAGERLQVRTAMSEEHWDEISLMAKEQLNKYVELSSFSNRKQILLSLLLMCEDILQMRKRMLELEENENKRARAFDKIIALLEEDDLEIEFSEEDTSPSVEENPLKGEF